MRPDDASLYRSIMPAFIQHHVLVKLGECFRVRQKHSVDPGLLEDSAAVPRGRLAPTAITSPTKEMHLPARPNAQL
jgi:hypothetical protein